MTSIKNLPREHPWLTVGAAAAAGALLGALSRRGLPRLRDGHAGDIARDAARTLVRVALVEGARRAAAHLVSTHPQPDPTAGSNGTSHEHQRRQDHDDSRPSTRAG